MNCHFLPLDFSSGAVVDAGFSMQNVELTIAVGAAILQARGNLGLAERPRQPLQF
jgi:hypothetical protein